MQPLYRSLYTELNIQPGPKTPEGVYARAVDGRTLYVNTTTEDKDIAVDGQKTGILSGKTYKGMLHLAPYGVDLVERLAWQFSRTIIDDPGSDSR